jgi:hypothetical protein
VVVVLVGTGHRLQDITLVAGQVLKVKFQQPLEQHTPLLLALAGQQLPGVHHPEVLIMLMETKEVIHQFLELV